MSAEINRETVCRTAATLACLPRPDACAAFRSVFHAVWLRYGPEVAEEFCDLVLAELERLAEQQVTVH